MLSFDVTWIQMFVTVKKFTQVCRNALEYFLIKKKKSCMLLKIYTLNHFQDKIKWKSNSSQHIGKFFWDVLLIRDRNEREQFHECRSSRNIRSQWVEKLRQYLHGENYLYSELKTAYVSFLWLRHSDYANHLHVVVVLDFIVRL